MAILADYAIIYQNNLEISMSIRTPKVLNHAPRKRFGQNFLHDTNIIRQIVDSVHLSPKDNLLEIGPGLGALT